MLLSLVVVLGVLSVMFVLPYLQYVLAAVLLGYVLHPAHRRLSTLVGNRISAFALVVVALTTLIIPVVLLTAIAVRQALDLVNQFSALPLDPASVEFVISRLTGFSVDIEAVFSSVTITPDSILSSLGQSNGAILGGVLAFLGGLSKAAIGFTIFLFVIYYLLKDGRKLRVWLRDTLPVPDPIQNRLYTKFDQIMWAVLVGNVLVAAVQAVLTGIGLLAVGVPNAVFWTIITFILSLLPIIGASVVWIPASIYLLVVGRPVAALGLFVYGMIVVSLSDNYLRPLVVDRGARINPSVVVIGIFGGLVVFGFMGIFFGPIVLGGFKIAVEVFFEEYHRV